MKKYILILINIAAIISCNNFKTDPADKVLALYHRYSNDTIYRTDSIHIDKLTNNKSIKYLYKYQNDILRFSILKDATNDSSIILDNVKCRLISTKEIMVKGARFEIKKYYFDDKNAWDEESSFFYNDNYGILLLFNEGWKNLKFSIEYDSISKILTENILQDTTRFYPGYIPSAPLEK